MSIVHVQKFINNHVIRYGKETTTTTKHMVPALSCVRTNAHDLFALDISQNAVTLMNYALSQYALTCLDKSNSNNPPLKPENGFSSKITNDQTMSNKIFSDGIGVLEKKFLFFDDIDWYRIG